MKMAQGAAESEMENEEDLKQRLDTHEKDLMLAAELGKALLDKNEEISKQRESMVMEYLQKVEVCEGFNIRAFFPLLFTSSGLGAGKVPSEEENGGSRGGVPTAVGGASFGYPEPEEGSGKAGTEEETL